MLGNGFKVMDVEINTEKCRGVVEVARAQVI